MPKTRRNRPNIEDVARMADVSIATVSRVVNQSVPVNPETSRRVLAAISQLGYFPHAAARSLASQKTHTLGLLLPEIGGNYFPPMLRGIERAVRQAGYDLLIHSTYPHGGPTQPTSHLLGSHNTDGLLVFTEAMPEEGLIRLAATGLPLVLLHQSPPLGLDIPCVTIENKSGAFKIVSHLIEVHGRHRIAFLAGPPQHEDSTWREQGYREALQIHGLPYDPCLVGPGGFEEALARQTVERWLYDGLDFDAIFAGDDESATGALTALTWDGKRVPEEVALAGFDDIDLSRYLSPPLTTVRAPIEQVGEVAVQTLIGLIRGEPVQPLQMLSTELVIRRSCGCE